MKHLQVKLDTLTIAIAAIQGKRIRNGMWMSHDDHVINKGLDKAVDTLDKLRDDVLDKMAKSPVQSSK